MQRVGVVTDAASMRLLAVRHRQRARRSLPSVALAFSLNSSASCSLTPYVIVPSIGCVALPKPRSNISLIAATRTASLSALVASRISSFTRVGASWRQLSFSSRVIMLGVPFLRPAPGRRPPFLPLIFGLSFSVSLLISSKPLLRGLPDLFIALGYGDSLGLWG